MSKETLERLEQIAPVERTNEWKVNLMQGAAQLLEESVGRIELEA